MILKKRQRVSPTTQKQIIFTGGLDESSSGVELKPGRLVSCENYAELPGVAHGYTSYPGFERYDGQALSSSVDVYSLPASGSYILAGKDFTDPVWTDPSATWTILGGADTFTDPDGGTTAEKIRADAATVTIRQAVDAAVPAGSVFNIYTAHITYNIGDTITVNWGGGATKDITPGVDGQWDYYSITDLVKGGGGDYIEITITGAVAGSSQYSLWGAVFTHPTAEPGDVVNDTAREAQRALIKKIGDAGCEGKTLGVVLRGTDSAVFGFRNDVTPGVEAGMYKATGSGWGSKIVGNEMTHDGTGVAFIVGETITGGVSGATGTVKELGPGANDMRVDVTSGATSFNATEAVTGSVAGSRTLTAVNRSLFNRDGFFRTAEGRFASFNSNAPIIAIVDGVSEPHLFFNDVLSPIVESAGTLPSTYPTHVGIWKNRLFLAYPGGHLLFSVVGDPTDWDATANAGEIYVGEDITDIVIAPGGKLIVTTLNKIRVISYETTAASPNPFLFSMEEFSDTSGSIPDTMKRMLGTMYFCDDRGVTTLEATDAFGDFAANSLAKRVEETYQSLKQNISVSHTDRTRDQYTVWANVSGEATGMVFTFGHQKKLRGAGLAKLPVTVECITEGKNDDRDDLIYFGDADGYVHKMNSGTSFDGSAIATTAETASYHYGSPTKWKHFKRLILEVSASLYTVLTYTVKFDFNNSKMPTSVSQESRITDAFKIFKLRTIGYGSSMSLSFSTSSKYREPHTLHNMITEYASGSSQSN